MSKSEIQKLSQDEILRAQLHEAAALTGVVRKIGWIIVSSILAGILPLISWATYVQVQNHYTLRGISETYGQTRERVTVMWIGGKWEDRK